MGERESGREADKETGDRRRGERKYDLAIALALVVLPLLWFWPQTFGGKTLLPADNLYQYQPWQSFAGELGVGAPYNPLISDLVLENVQWKSFIIEQLRAGSPADILWNPLIFTGVPFLAAGQHSALYPLSIVFYLLPLWQAYGVFSALQLGLAAVAMFVFARVLGQRRPAATVAAIVYAFSGFYIVSVNFTMMIAAVAWLPLILAMIEGMIRKQEEKGPTPYSPVPYVAAGAIFLGIQTLAGHIEITYYVLLVSAFWAAWRLITLYLHLRARPFIIHPSAIIIRLGLWLIAMVGLGLALGGVQLIPLYELVTQSFREGSATFQQVREWAWPKSQILTFFLPDFFGNPTHHAYLDIWRGVWLPVTRNGLGQPLRTIDWGIKNYVEGANYLSLMTWVLAGVGVVAGIKRKRSILGFALLAVLSLLFAFGTPLYAIPFYLLPGYKQLHSAFRWVFPYTLSMAALAGYGLSLLLEAKVEAEAKVARWLGIAAAGAGAGALAIVLISRFVPGPFVALGSRLVAASVLARERGFADGAMAWSYEALNLAKFGLMAALTGVVLFWGARRAKSPSPQSPSAFHVPRSVFSWPLAIIAVLILDLWLFGRGFNPATDPKLLAFTPPAIEWLQSQRDPAQPWRLTSFDGPDEKTLNANSAMRYGLEDVRGYDSIIPKQYVEYMKRIQPQGELLYNRIASIYTQLGDHSNYEALDNSLFNLLGVRYVVTTHAIPNAGYELAYDGEVKIFRNKQALPRTFVVPQAVVAADQQAALDAIGKLDPAQTVVVELSQSAGLPVSHSPTLPLSPAPVGEARISKYTPRQIFVDVNLSDPGWLVLTDSFAEGWKAYLRPFGATGEGVTAGGGSVEQQLPIYRADGAFRAVYLPSAGQWTVRFVYSPRSFILGLYVSFLAVVSLMLVVGWWLWGRLALGRRGEGGEVGRVAKNSVVQMTTALMARTIDFAFAMLRLRLLGPQGEGSYAFAITFYGTFEILTRFGLGTLLTRDVAKNRSDARRYLINVVGLRSLLWLATLPIMAIVAVAYRSQGQLSPETSQAIVLFVLALLFANIADGISSVFFAFEQMEYPAGIATAVAVAKVALGALVLLPPFEMGFVGLAGVSLVMNVVQVIWLFIIMRRTVLPPLQAPRQQLSRAVSQSPSLPVSQSPTLRLDWRLQRYMLGESGPLMINHLLASVFWRINLYILQWFAGAAAVGIFSAATKYIDGLNVIPSYFTAAIFPLMSRYAARRGQTDALARAYRLAVQLLFILALPIAVAFTFLAEPLIRILGGAAYLPDSAVALQLMIWSIPIGWVNSVTQYALISVGQQRFLTGAFIIGVSFTGAANLLLVPRFGYIASAMLLTPAEIALFLPFYWAVRRHVTHMPWVRLCSGPLLAAGVNAAVVWGMQRIGLPTLIGVIVGFLAYIALLALLGTFRSEDFGVLLARLPGLRRARD